MTKHALSTAREKSDCGVRALAAACEVSYEEAYQALSDAGRKPRHWTYDKQLEKAARALGKRLQKNVSMAGTTVRKLGRELPSANWIVHVRGHYLAVVGGQVIDWSVGRLFRAKYAFKVITCNKA